MKPEFGKLPITTWLLTVATIIAIILGTAAWTSFQQLGQLSAQRQWVLHTHELITLIATTEAVITSAETGQRGYLLTGRKSYLEPYYSAHEKLGSLLQTQDRQQNEGTPTDNRLVGKPKA
jgi:CHASE3 domain sensor protein